MATRNQNRKGIATAYPIVDFLSRPLGRLRANDSHREAEHLCRSRPRIRSHDEIESDRDMPLGSGLCSRELVPGQGENDQFPGRDFSRWRSDDEW